MGRVDGIGNILRFLGESLEGPEDWGPRSRPSMPTPLRSEGRRTVVSDKIRAPAIWCTATLLPVAKVRIALRRLLTQTAAR
jgi:hypothetical protein